MDKFFLKSENIKLTDGLTSKEFSCRCIYPECRSGWISEKLILCYAQFRKILGVALIINSGHRCARHNFDVGGKPLSRHLNGYAVDISRKSLQHLTDEEINHAAKIAGFTKIIFYKTFVHFDCR